MALKRYLSNTHTHTHTLSHTNTRSLHTGQLVLTFCVVIFASGFGKCGRYQVFSCESSADGDLAFQRNIISLQQKIDVGHCKSVIVYTVIEMSFSMCVYVYGVRICMCLYLKLPPLTCSSLSLSLSLSSSLSLSLPLSLSETGG